MRDSEHKEPQIWQQQEHVEWVILLLMTIKPHWLMKTCCLICTLYLHLKDLSAQPTIKKSLKKLRDTPAIFWILSKKP